MSKLYELAHEYSNVLEAINLHFDEHPELDEVTKNAIISENLNELQDSFETKSLALAGFIMNQRLELASVKTVQDSLSKRAKSLERTITQLNDYLLQQMQEVNIPKLSNSWLTIQIRKNPAKVIVEDETLLSDEFKITEQVIKINKSAISEQLKAGQFVPYAHLEQSQRLEIK